MGKRFFFSDILERKNPAGKGGALKSQTETGVTKVKVDQNVEPDKTEAPVIDMRAAARIAPKMRWAINGETGFKQMLITPEIANEMLAYNDRNRPLAQQHVNDIARMMTDGKWHETPNPIVFSREGRLTDGQHRLAAIAQSGISQTMWVFFGDADDNFYVFDTGARRTAGHIFAINGVGDYNVLAAAARVVMFYDNHSYGSATGSGNTRSVSNEDLWAFFQGNLRLTESIRIGNAFYEHRLASKSLMAALHYICARKARQQSDEFFLKAATGVGLASRGEPAGRLHAKLIELATSQTRARAPYIAALVIKAWNAERSGAKVLGRLTYRTEANPDESFPRAR